MSVSSISPYQAQYASTQVQDAEELMQVSFASPAEAQANVAGVLAQAAAAQQQQQAQAQQAVQAAADAAIQGTPSSSPTPGSSATDPLSFSLGTVIDQSDQAANAAIDNFVNDGQSIDLFA